MNTMLETQLYASSVMESITKNKNMDLRLGNLLQSEDSCIQFLGRCVQNRINYIEFNALMTDSLARREIVPQLVELITSPKSQGTIFNYSKEQVEEIRSVNDSRDVEIRERFRYELKEMIMNQPEHRGMPLFDVKALWKLFMSDELFMKMFPETYDGDYKKLYDLGSDNMAIIMMFLGLADVVKSNEENHDMTWEQFKKEADGVVDRYVKRWNVSFDSARVYNFTKKFVTRELYDNMFGGNNQPENPTNLLDNVMSFI